MKSLINILMPVMALFVFSQCEAQIQNAKTETIKVYGNCGMCEKTIEKAANKKGEAKAEWDKDTKMAQITFDTSKTSLDDVLKRIADAGYDSDKFTANDAAYANLHSCCQYERAATTTAVSTGIEAEKPAPANEVVATPVPTPAPAPLPTQGMVKKQASTGVAVVAGNPLTAVYSAYFALKDALVASDGIAAASTAKTLSDAIGNVKMDALSTAQHSVWMKYEQKLRKDADRIKAITDIDSQREYFMALSKNMYEVMKVIKPETAVYLDHCPMYNDGKGADWLSLEKGIKNPYYGKSMMTCGNVKETLK